MLHRLGAALGLATSVIADLYRDFRVGFIDGFIAHSMSDIEAVGFEELEEDEEEA